MAESKEVRAKLTLDDQASKTLDKIKEGMNDTARAGESAQLSMGFVKQTLSTMAAMNFVPAVKGVVDFAKGFVEASAGAQDFVQGISGFMAMANAHLSWEQAYSASEKLKDSLSEIGIAAGQGIDDVRGAFSTLTMFYGATEKGLERAKVQTQSLTTIANVLGMNAADLARQFGLMARGQLPEMASAMRQLLTPTGIFNSDIRKATTEWQMLTDEQRLDALATGLDQVASRLGKATPTFHDLNTVIGNIWKVAQEKIGEPVMKALIPELKSVSPLLEQAGEDVADYARVMSKDVGKWIKDGMQSFKDGLQYLRTHHEEIKAALVEGSRNLRNVVEFMLAHKAEIALMFGARAAMPVLEQGKKVYDMGAGGSAIAGMPMGGMAGGIAAVAAFTAAIAAAGLAVDQFRKYLNETQGGRSMAEQDQLARKQRIDEMIAKPDVHQWSEAEHEGFTHLREQYVAAAEAAGENARAAGEYVDKAWEAHRAVRAQVQDQERMSEVLATLQATGGVEGIDLGPMVEKFTTGFESARAAGNTAVAQYIADLLAKSSALHGAFLNSANLTGEGFSALAEMIGNKSAEFAEKLKALGLKETQATGGNAPKAVINMNGGQTFHVKQDFRDQDPDRVAVLFQRGITRSIESRLQARTTNPFGA